MAEKTGFCIFVISFLKQKALLRNRDGCPTHKKPKPKAKYQLFLPATLKDYLDSPITKLKAPEMPEGNL